MSQVEGYKIHGLGKRVFPVAYIITAWIRWKSPSRYSKYSIWEYCISIYCACARVCKRRCNISRFIECLFEGSKYFCFPKPLL